MKINYALSDKEVSQNLVLSCQAVPTTDKVIVDGSFNGTQLTINDLRKFKGVFSTNQFFIQNEDAEILIDGRLYGKINALKAKDLALSIGDDLKLLGSFSSKNLAVKDEEYLRIEDIKNQLLS